MEPDRHRRAPDAEESRPRTGRVCVWCIPIVAVIAVMALAEMTLGRPVTEIQYDFLLVMLALVLAWFTTRCD